MKTSLLKPLLAAILTLGLFAPARAETEIYRPYSALIREAVAKAGTDEVTAALEIIGAADGLSASGVAARIKHELPQIDPRATVRVLDEVLANIVREGEEYRRLCAALQPLTSFLGLEGRIHVVIFRSEVPVVALSPPNGLMVSTRVLALLSDGELRAVVAHELCHLPLTEVFRAAVDAKDYRTMRLIELFCDAGAVAVTAARGEAPSLLIKGLSRMQQVLELEFGETGRKGKHPTLAERARLVKKLSRRLLS